MSLCNNCVNYNGHVYVQEYIRSILIKLYIIYMYMYTLQRLLHMYILCNLSIFGPNEKQHRIF